MFECSERLFEVASIDEKREVVSLLLSSLKLDGKNFTFNLKEPFATLISQSKGSSWLIFTTKLEPISSKMRKLSPAA